MAEIDDLNKQLEEERKKTRQYQQPSDLRGFYAYNRIINAQVDILESFDLGKEIKAKVEKDDKYYDRVETIIEKLPLHLSKVNTLKSELGITGDEKKDTSRKIVSPESMAQDIGDNKTQNV